MKKLIAAVLSAVTACSSFAAFAVDYGEEYESRPQQQTSQRFSDVPTTHWAFDYIGEMAQREVISGYPDGRFLPESQVTRAEFAKIMVCAAGLRVSNTYQTSFTDVYTDDWYCPYIESAKEYLTGYSTYSGMVYRPTTPALREDIAIALVKLKGYDTSIADESILNMFNDSYSISDSARKYVAVAVERGLISGYDDNTFRGQATITRAEAATMLWRAFQYGNDNKVTDPSENNTSQTTSIPEATITPEATNGTETTSPSEATIEPEAEEKPYKVDTLKSVNLKYPTLHSTYDYEGEKIYYLDGTEVYELDPYTGDTRSIYDASDLTFQVEETQDEEEKEYSSYKPTQIIYDKYNDRLILNGYFSHLEQPFEQPSDKEKYRVAYDITNDEIYLEFGPDDNSTMEILTFLAKNKVLVKYSFSNYAHIINEDSGSTTGINIYSFVKDEKSFWEFNNNLYLYRKDYTGDHSIFKYNFSDDFEFITRVEATQMGVNGQYVYYSSNEGVGSNSSVKMYKLDMNTGSIEELDITTDDDRCMVMDMQPIRLYNEVFIPVADDYFVFYDTSADAFRALTRS